MNFEWPKQSKERIESIRELFTEEMLSALLLASQADDKELAARWKTLLQKLESCGYWELAQQQLKEADVSLLAALEIELAKQNAALALAAQQTRLFTQAASLLPDCYPPKPGEALVSTVLVDSQSAPILEESGEGYSLSGHASMVPLAALAEWFAIEAQFNDKPVLVLVEASAHGVSRSSGVRCSGLHALAFADVTFEQVAISRERCSNPDKSSGALQQLHALQDLGLCAAAAGVMQAAFTAARANAEKTTEQGRSKMARQQVRYKLAELLTLNQTAEWMLLRAAWLLQSGDFEASTVVKSAKVFCGESAHEVAQAALQIAGVEGYRSGADFERFVADSRYLLLAGTTAGQAKLQIADDLLKRYEV